ncbi:AAA family ATPase [Dethiobacter alkaliphilus]|uniref:AAA family ATPase n=1 Tax=Dethiobacter alkaliphilus TaxID=427926 RepID=UPI0022271700|nr:AAA family ATPase [Dethiobacter alkaliphilus]MCW3491543.1 AAA family ATPase [Dethiobacter alkaliphilus]
MMVLYLDKFRGFSDTFIPLTNVNFLVGENSTGKTSVLSLLKLLSDRKFLHLYEFNNEQVSLGFFEEIANEKAKKFKIGFYNNNSNEEVLNSPFLFTFTNMDGVPYLSKINMLINKLNIEITITPKNIRFRYKKYLNNSSNFLVDFKDWVINTEKDLLNLRNNDLNYKVKHTPMPLHFLIFLVLEQIDSLNQIDSDEILGFFGHFDDGLLRPVTWIAPIRAKPKRIYDSYNVNFSPEGDHIPYLLKKVFGQKRSLEKNNDEINAFVEFGKESGMFQLVDIKNLGNKKTAPFEIEVIINHKPYKISNVGYGVAQVLPVITEIILSKKNSIFAIQQPEVHLHPKAQASLGDFIYNAAKKHDFLIETHSDYFIDRFRLAIRRNGYIKSQILFFERNTDGNQVTQIDIQEDGMYSTNQPSAFREFFIQEELNLIGG